MLEILGQLFFSENMDDQSSGGDDDDSSLFTCEEILHEMGFNVSLISRALNDEDPSQTNNMQSNTLPLGNYSLLTQFTIPIVYVIMILLFCILNVMCHLNYAFLPGIT